MGIIYRQLPTGFIAFLKYIFKHVDANKVNEFIEHYEREKAINRVLKSIKQIDPNQLLEIIRDMDGTAIVTAAATVFIAVFSGTLWWVNRRQGSDARVIQRAYVKISHSSPGVEIGENGNFWHQATVKNFGQTPARVTDVVMKPLVVARGSCYPPNQITLAKDPGPVILTLRWLQPSRLAISATLLALPLSIWSSHRRPRDSAAIRRARASARIGPASWRYHWHLWPPRSSRPRSMEGYPEIPESGAD